MCYDPKWKQYPVCPRGDFLSLLFAYLICPIEWGLTSQSHLYVSLFFATTALMFENYSELISRDGMMIVWLLLYGTQPCLNDNLHLMGRTLTPEGEGIKKAHHLITCSQTLNGLSAGIRAHRKTRIIYFSHKSLHSTWVVLDWTSSWWNEFQWAGYSQAFLPQIECFSVRIENRKYLYRLNFIYYK